MIKARIIIIFVIVLLLGALCSGNFLVVDEPHKAEVILVLAGETNRRPERGLKLYRQGYSSKVIIDVPANERVYSWAEVELAHCVKPSPYRSFRLQRRNRKNTKTPTTRLRA